MDVSRSARILRITGKIRFIDALAIYKILAVLNHSTETRVRWRKKRGAECQCLLNRADFSENIPAQNRIDFLVNPARSSLAQFARGARSSARRLVCAHRA